LGLDASAAAAGEDDEPTGLFVSNGSVSKDALLGTEKSLEDAKGFLTRQHGDNKVFRIFHKLRANALSDGLECESALKSLYARIFLTQAGTRFA
jgi:hypothetical protein